MKTAMYITKITYIFNVLVIRSGCVNDPFLFIVDKYVHIEQRLIIDTTY